MELLPVKDYPRGQAGKFVYGGMTAIFGQKPKLKPYQVCIEDYDLIVIGTPVWAGRNAPPINTFLRDHPIKGKTAALFASSGGGNAEGCFRHMKSKLGTVAATLSLVNAAEDLKRTEAQIDVFADTLNGLL